MLRNYLLLTVRNLLRRKTYALINLIGLTLGLACIALVVLYAHYEQGHDRFHERSEDIYRLEHHFRSSWYSTLGYNNYFQSTVADQMAYPLHLREFPQVEEATQILQAVNTYVEADDRRWVVDNILYTLTGEAFLEMFTLEWVAGTPETALSQPYSAVITDKTAERFFGSADPLGATLIHDSTELTITGVVKPMPQNSHLHPDMVLQMGRIPHWGAHTYVRVQPGTDMQALAEQVVPPNERYATSDLFKGVRFTPLADIHFAARTKYDFQLREMTATSTVFW